MDRKRYAVLPMAWLAGTLVGGLPAKAQEAVEAEEGYTHEFPLLTRAQMFALLRHRALHADVYDCAATHVGYEKPNPEYYWLKAEGCTGPQPDMQFMSTPTDHAETVASLRNLKPCFVPEGVVETPPGAQKIGVIDYYFPEECPDAKTER